MITGALGNLIDGGLALGRGIGKGADWLVDGIGAGVGAVTRPVGKAAWAGTKATAKGIGHAGKFGLDAIGTTGIYAGKGALKASNKIGDGFIDTIARHPGKAMMGIGTVAGVSAMLHDADGLSPTDGAIGGAVAGTGAIALASTVGGGAMMAGGLATTGATLATAGLTVAGGLGGIGSKMVRIEKGYNPFNGKKMKPTLLGGAVMGIGSIYKGVAGAVDSFERSRMGQHDGQIKRPSPNINAAGATGDLVFALHKQR